MLEFSGNINLVDYILIDIEDVFLSNEYETYDIEIEEVNCFEARNPNSGFSYYNVIVFSIVTKI